MNGLFFQLQFSMPSYLEYVEKNKAKRIKYVESIGIIMPVKFDEDLFLRTFVHKSFAADYADNFPDNERLEFIGDAILGAIISKALFNDFPELSEADLTMHKIALVRTETLASTARMLEIGNHLLLGSGEQRADGRNKNKVLADAYEALIGMQYEILGYDATQSFIINTLYYRKQEIFASMTIKSYKSQLQEWLQKHYKTVPTYIDSVEEMDEYGNAIVYRSIAMQGDRVLGSGVGSNKKKAQEDAASDAYHSLVRE